MFTEITIMFMYVINILI